ncbi:MULTISPECIES: penicillin-binding protein 2 [Methylobacterium]|uniref:peptidoglycan D,D-transpeptidase FtsI family protein n=1 Tax=Methylobacterium TaxID=407 RepID=UPI000B896ADF|nr:MULTISPECIES: penicillin-binding protein 2 [Methylobacterium]MBK3395796.1 penicillin-binding protein 2 [Methylobacterium ajmalii]MBK3410287.1 penicillin-binding protein 2 [Methylobacterium ajmalii]MBK3423194.1 penicillin-binding protein 2 [Methylobacterium ajmalii]MBZ6412123.1 penicillin-binding protein 2 [Methylobacterium sp.]
MPETGAQPVDDAPQPAPGRSLAALLRGGVLAMFRLSVERSAARVGLVSLVFGAVFLTLMGRLASFALFPDDPVTASARRAEAGGTTQIRPDIIDRNGEILATDIRTVSVFAEPKNIYDKDEAVELLTAVLPEINARDLREKLSSKKGFVWVKREITPRQQVEVHRLGIPGVGFLPDHKRVYPNGTAAAHILGVTNLDNVGIAGIEKYIDRQGLRDLTSLGFVEKSADMAPVQLSIDLRAQHAVRDELAWGMEHYRAKAAAGLILDVTTGEVIALASLPDFDPNEPKDALDPDRINRMNVGVYEMGSTFKAMTLAMALDSGKFNVNSTFDTRGGVLHWGRQKIHEYHGTNRVITMPEVFTHSSNIGSAKMALGIGVPGHKAFLKKMGLLDRLRTELPESAEPIIPPRWTEINTITIAFGHGLAVAPLQASAAVAAIANGGFLMTPTFLKRTEAEAREKATQVLSAQTSEAMRYIMRLNATEGSAKKAAIPYYYVGGKTGTAEKVIRGRYVKNRLFTTFMAAAPMDKPKYLFVTIMDEPQAVAAESGSYATAAWNSGVVTGRVIARVAPILGLPPQFEPPAKPFPLMVKLGAYHVNQVDGR